ITLCYDADEAGIKAALRGGQVLFQNNLEVKLLILPEGEDPDSFVRKNGASAFFALQEGAKDYLMFKQQHLFSQIDPGNVTQKSYAVKELIDSIAAHPDPIKQNFYVRYLADSLSLQEETIIGQIKNSRRNRNLRERNREEKVTTSAITSFLTGAWGAEKDILIILLNFYNQVKDVIFEVLEEKDFQNAGFREVFNFIHSHPESDGREMMHLVLAQISDDQIRKILTRDLFSEINNPERYLNDCIRRIKISRYQTQLTFLRQQLQTISPDETGHQDILKEINDTLHHIREVNRIFPE
ncbi:MAG: toprim domain-containing protein, partial [Calditrichia bacterium]